MAIQADMNEQLKLPNRNNFLRTSFHFSPENDGQGILFCFRFATSTILAVYNA